MVSLVLAVGKWLGSCSLGLVLGAGCHPQTQRVDAPQPSATANKLQAATMQERGCLCSDLDGQVPTRTQVNACLACWDEQRALEQQKRRVMADPQATDEVVYLVQLAQGLIPSEELMQFFAGLEHLTPARSLGQGLMAYEQYLATGAQSDFVQAQAEIRAALAVRSDDPFARASAVALYLARGQQVPSYLELVRKLCEQDAGDAAVVLAACAQVAFAVGDPTNGHRRFARATELEPQLHGAWLLWGEHALAAGRLEDAVRNFSRATAAALPGLKYDAYLGLGASLFLQGDLVAAEAAYRTAAHAYMRAKPVSPEKVPAALQYNLGLTLAKRPEKTSQIEALTWLEAFVSNRQAQPQRLLRARQTVELVRRRWQLEK